MDDIQPREPKDVLVFIMKCPEEVGCTWANKRRMIHSVLPKKKKKKFLFYLRYENL